ncbi:MAG: SprT-like domain-containing protein [Planctomycetia bacterium]
MGEPAPIREILSRHLPREAEPYVTGLLGGRDVVVRVSRPRLTKLGDHRPPRAGDRGHRISINADLNPYAFLTTLLHEIAHVDAWVSHGWRRRTKPHGPEWKAAFGAILAPVVSAGWLPEDVAAALAASMRNPTAMSCSDRGLVLALARYDDAPPTRMRVEEIPLGGLFRVDNGRIFCRGRRVRTRYLCVEHQTGAEFRVHALARAEAVEPSPATAGRPTATRSATAAAARYSRRRAAGGRASARSVCFGSARGTRRT